MSKNLLDYVGLGHFLEKIKTLFVTALGTSGNNLTWTKNGTTNNITIPYATKSSELVPLQTKQYADVIGTANNNPGAVFYFMSVRPNDWYNPCRVVYKISAEMSGLAAGKAFSIISMVFSRNTVPSYDIWNYIGSTDYRPYYYHYRYLATSTGYNNNYGHLMGIGMNSSYSPTSSTYARDFKIEVLEVTNCTVTLFDTMTKYASVPGTGSTNYNGEATYDGTTNGETHVGDRNDVNYNNREYYASRKTNSALYRYMLCMTKSDGSLVPINSVNNSIATDKTLTTDSFDPFGEIFYWSSTTTYTAGANVGNGSLYRLVMMDLRYSFNYTLGTFTARLPVYLVAVPLINGTAILHTSPLTQVLPTTEDGLIYIYLGVVYEDANTYRVNLSIHHPVYYYKDGALRLWTNANIPTKTSELTNDSGFLTLHQDISGKENTSNKVTSLSSSSTDTLYPSARAVYSTTSILAPKASPALTGTPTAPTATAGTNTTQIATTAFVNIAITGKEDNTNKVTSLSSSSTDTQYPSAKCVYDAINADAPYIIESTNGVAEKSVALIQTLYYQTTSNIALRYNGKLYPFVAFYDSNSMAWGGDIRQLGQNRTYINIIKLIDKNLSVQSVDVDVVKSVEDNSDASNLTKYYARKEDNGITLTLDANGSLGISTLNGVIGPASWGYADLDYFVTGKTVYNAIEPLATKASPAFTGTPTAPTAAVGTNTTQIATTAFVKNAVDSKVHYVANLLSGTAANYITEPEVKTIKINGSTTNSASTNNCVLLYDTTNKCLKFVFN